MASYDQGVDIGDLLQALDRLLLDVALVGGEPRAKGLADSNSPLFKVLRAVLQYLFEHPNDGTARVHLVRTLSRRSSGSDGLVLVMHEVLNAAIIVDVQVRPPNRSVPEEDVAALQPAYKQWFNANSAVGATIDIFKARPLPAALAALDLARLQSASEQVIEHANWRFAEEPGNAEFIRLQLAFHHDLAAATGDTSSFVDCLRLVCAGFVNAREFQAARNLVEGALLWSQTQPAATRRSVWSIHAETYRRLQQPLEGLVGLLVADSGGVTPGIEQAFQEVITAVYALRDLGASERALERLQVARDILGKAGLEKSLSFRLDVTATQIRYFLLLKNEANGTPDAFRLGLVDVGNALVTGLHAELELGGDVLIAGSLLAQVIRHGRLKHIDLPPHFLAALEFAMGRVGEPAAGKLRDLMSPSFTREQLLNAAEKVGPALYADDVGTDANELQLHALRALELSDFEPCDRLLAIELMANHAVPVTGSANTVSILVRRWDAILEGLVALTKSGVEVQALALAQDGALLRTSIVAGEVASTREGESIFSADRFDDWIERDLADAGDPNHRARPHSEWLAEYERIGSSAGRPTGAVVVVHTGRLSRLPPQLLVRSGELSGCLGPIAVVPSLTWWWSTRQSPARAAEYQELAWILPADAEQPRKALAPLAASIRAFAGGRKMSVFDANAPPRGEPASVLVLGAHGVLAGSAFRLLGGETPRSQLSSVETARAFNDARLVVLLVCHAGRLTPEPNSTRVLGLPSEFLQAGARAVVASAWPLNAELAARWLAHFFKEWDGGASVGEAVFFANRALRAEGVAAVDYLAMYVVGDPELKKADLTQ